LTAIACSCTFLNLVTSVFAMQLLYGDPDTLDIAFSMHTMFKFNFSYTLILDIEHKIQLFKKIFTKNVSKSFAEPHQFDDAVPALAPGLYDKAS
jgi:hypothetical protein